jgi:hypothetical protein
MSTNEVSSNPNASAAWSPNQRKFANLRKFVSEPVPEVYGGDNRRIISYTHAYTKAYGKDSHVKGTVNGGWSKGAIMRRNPVRFFLTAPRALCHVDRYRKCGSPAHEPGRNPPPLRGVNKTCRQLRARST